LHTKGKQMENNIFDFATSELSHSAFFAWLISQIAPKSDYHADVSEKGLELVNECLIISGNSTINKLEDIDKIVVKRELSHIDIVVFIRAKNNRKIGIIIENKVGAQESRKRQLLDYFEEGQKLIDGYFKNEKNEKVFIYLKSDYDYDDPLVRFDSKRKLISTNFKKIGWKSLYRIFENSKSSNDSILKSYSYWIEEKHNLIESKLNINTQISSSKGIEQLEEDHVGQVHILKSVFCELFDGKKPFCGEKDDNGYYRWYYKPNIFVKLGTDKGSPWSELWFSDLGFDELSFFYRIQLNKPQPLLHARLGYWGTEDRIKEKKELYERYMICVKKYGLLDLTSNFKFNSNNYVSTLCAFKLIGNSIEQLSEIQKIHLDFIGKKS
jgi:hypothetical protein